MPGLFVSPPMGHRSVGRSAVPPCRPKAARRTAKKRSGSLVYAAALLALAILPVRASDTAKPDASSKDAAEPVLQLRLAPAAVHFSDAREYRRVLVFGKTATGEVDLSRSAQFAPSNDCVELDNTGLLHPRANCQAKVVVTAAGRTAELPVSVSGLGQAHPVTFVRDIEPILNKVGCTTGACHGAAKGKNGFKLSLRGYDAQFDYDALIHDLSGRRFNRSDPARSLMLMKPAAQVMHGGGLRLDVTSPYYRAILDWISSGVPFGEASAAHVTSLEVVPTSILMPRPGLAQQLSVLAHYVDGSSRDVSREALYASTMPSVADVSRDGLITTLRNGEAAINVRYEGAFVTLNTTVLPARPGFRWVQMPRYNYIDSSIDNKLRRLHILPSEIAGEEEFLRRVSLDLIGLPPSPREVLAFVADPAPQHVKRARKIDELMSRPEYVDHWSLKWADLLKNNRKYLGEKGVWRYREWIRQAVADNKPYNRFAYELITARGSNYENPAANYFLASGANPKQAMETTTQVFLGVRFVCAQCHDHPFEQWTQHNYYDLAAFFARVNVRDGAAEQEKIVYENPTEGDVRYPKGGKVAQPRFPYLQPVRLSLDQGRRETLAQWLVSQENPYFAEAIVNRLWSYFFARGIIEPVDDIRASNPPVNPELLNALIRDFVAHRYDLRYLMRTIVNSRTYQLSYRSNDWNADDENNFSHAIPRRLTAEELMDAITIATGSREAFKEVPRDFTAEELPEPHVGMGGFLDLFGRPQRESPCECERRSEVSLKQALNLINGPTVGGAVADPKGVVAKLVLEGARDRKLVEQLYLGALSRRPTANEYRQAQAYLKGGANRAERAQDLLWALLNSDAFLFNR